MRRLGFPKKAHASLSFEVPEATMRLLCAAAEGRRTSIERLAQLILIGTVCRVSIDRTINGFRFDARFPESLSASAAEV